MWISTASGSERDSRYAPPVETRSLPLAVLIRRTELLVSSRSPIAWTMMKSA